MTYTILSANYANADRTCAVIQTKEAAAVLVSKQDHPELWATRKTWGNIAEYVAPEQEVVDPVKKLANFLSANPDVRALLEA